MKYPLVVMSMLLLLSLGQTQAAFAEGFAIKSGDTIQKILDSRKGTRVTLRLADGGELSGKVRSVTKELVQLGELSNQEFFEGVIEIGKISAVIVRVKE